MTLDYLLFDYSEGSDGTGVYDAMAAVSPAAADTVQAEVAQVLAWAEAQFPGGHAPVEDGGDWDAELDVSDEANGGNTRRVFTLSIAGSEAFCAAFAVQFADALA